MPRCARRVGAPAKPGAKAEAKSAHKQPSIESSGVSPAVDNTIPLLRPGTFRLDIAGFAATHPIFGVGPPRPALTDYLEAATIGYGVNDRLTVFAGALEVNSDQRGGTYKADYIDPKVGFVYRLATASEFRGSSLDFVGDVTINEPFGGSGIHGDLPFSDVGPVGRARLLLTREVAKGLILEAIGGLQAAQVTTQGPFGALGGQTTTDVDALLGLAGQYPLGFLSNRLYANGELDYMKPLTADAGQLIVDTPFKTTESYAATIGASYVIKPGSVVLRATDTIGLDLANPNQPFLGHAAGRQLSNTVGLTLSICNIEPGRW